MIVQTDIPCGNGRVKWLNPGIFEIEVIAYSKAPRYTCFKISHLEADRCQEIVLRPDPFFRNGNFSHFQGHIWVRCGRNGQWTPIRNDQLTVTPEYVRFSLDLKKGEEYWVSTEPPREYAETNAEIFHLVETMNGAARLHCLGNSIEHRPILLLRVTSPENQCKLGEETLPVITLMAGEHATEFAGEEIIRGMLGLVSDPDRGRVFRENFIFDFILNVNPDGNYHGWHQYNAKDWAEHNYADGKDRSWHHEFEPYLTGQLTPASPETIAIADYVIMACPAFLVSAHSWQGHNGNPGAFHTDFEFLSGSMIARLRALNRTAVDAARQLGVEFETYPTSNLCSGHLDTFLMKTDRCLAYNVEGHMNLGRARLQRLGALMLEGWLKDPETGLASSKTLQNRTLESTVP